MPYTDPEQAKARQKARRVARREADPEAFRQASRARYARDREKILARLRERRQADPEPRQGRDREAYWQDPEKERQRRRARYRGEDAPAPAVEAVPYRGDVSWQADAACVELDPELFFVEASGVNPEARAACAGCPVQAECLGMALAFPVWNTFGYWGGTTQRERARLAQEARARARDTGVTHERPEASGE
jgi:WhiB family redox-sensing transcriptional regulator